MNPDESLESVRADQPASMLRDDGDGGSSAWSVAPAVQRGPHVGPEFDSMIDLASRVIADSTHLHRVAHYTSSIHDFGVDVLDDPALSRSDDERPIATRRAGYLRGGQSLTFIVGQEDAELQKLRSGRMIRTVLHSDRGAIFCAPVRRGEYLTGLSLDDTRTAVDAADLTLAELVTAIRGQVGLGSQNPGGWLTARPSESDVWLGPIRSQAGDESFEFRGEESRAMTGLFRGAVGREHLHYVATYRSGVMASSADCLDDPSIRHLFTQMTPGARRREYGEVGERFKSLAEKFDQLMRMAVKGHLVRVVFDVEQGAIYYYRLPDDGYMIGVTLVQAQVNAADHRMAELVDEYARLIGRR